MKSRDVKNLIFLIFVLFPSFTLADSWIQTDWSGGDGYFQWQDPTGYYEGIGVNGWRKPGSLTLFAPDFEHFYSIGKLSEAMGVYALYSDSLNRYYAGDTSSLGNAKLYISTDFGNTWKGSVIHSTIINKVTSIFLPSFTFDTVIFVGTSPSRIYKSIHMGDSGWVYMLNPLSANYVSSILEIGGNGYLYASTVGTSNYLGKIWKAYQGNGWSPLSDSMQPYVNDKMPTGIFQFIMSKDNALYLSSYYNYNGIYVARIFRSYTLGVWELCTNLPDTLCRPFAMDIGYDTLGNYGIIYVGVEINGGIGKVFRSTDDGNSWDTCGTLEGPARTVNGIKVDGDGTVYASVYVIEGFDYVVKVFRSTDMGLTWENSSSIGGVLTNKPTAFHQTKRGFLLVGTENEAEIFRSGYVDSGYLVSSVYDVGTGNGSSNFDSIITWDENLNGQNLAIKVRTDSVDSMAGALPWNLCPVATNGEPLSNLISVDNGYRYIQYRVEFSTDSIDYSSELKEIEIKYSIDTIPPHIDTAYASDGSTPGYGIDGDDTVYIIFDDATNTPLIEGNIIDTVLRLSSGHRWIDTLTWYLEAEWITSKRLEISWPILLNLPSIEVGDTIYPDSFTITDIWGNPCYSPIVLTGSFDPPGIAEDVSPYESVERVTVFPQISRGKVNIKLNLKKDSDVKISFFDITGRLLHNIVERRYTKGIYSIGWYNRENPSGIYFIKTDINNKSHIDKVTIVK